MPNRRIPALAAKRSRKRAARPKIIFPSQSFTQGSMPTNSNITPKPSRASKEVTPATNPSPDSVECIDLTQTSVEDFLPPRKERQLGTVRKELEPSSAKKRKGTGGLKTTGLENVAPEEIIIIDSDDDDDDNDDDDTVPIACKLTHNNVCYVSQNIEMLCSHPIPILLL